MNVSVQGGGVIKKKRNYDDTIHVKEEGLILIHYGCYSINFKGLACFHLC